MGDVTVIISALREGDRRAADLLLEAVYDELRRLAASKLARERPGHTLQPTALVHEAYLRLVGDEKADWKNRAHFFAAAAEAMRRILIEGARRKASLKRGGDRHRVTYDEARLVSPPGGVDILALDEALEALAQEDRQIVDLVKLRFFAGLGIAEAAAVLGMSRATADRRWAYARAWLYEAMVAAGDGGADAKRGPFAH